MKVGIYGRNIKDQDAAYIRELFSLFEQKKVELVIFEDFFNQIKDKGITKNQYNLFKDHSDIVGKLDFLISIGGDGTLLDTLSIVKNSDIPIIGINLGRLGFLANVSRDEINDAIEALKRGTYVLDKRTLLHLESNKPLFGDVNYALNEFTIHKKDSSSMITIHAYLNGEYLNTYWSDGLIVSTPTGSTAYSLSCGGPVIFPASKNFVIVPVAPHNLNIRPMVVSDTNVISFEIEGRNEHFLCTLDSRFETIDASFQLAVRKENFTINLVRLSEHNFLSTLRKKLMWGADQRN